MTGLDRSAPVRSGEELDATALGPYLIDRLGVAGPLTIEQFPSGHSNLTYLIRLGDTAFVLRRPPFGNRVKSAHDMTREYRVLSALAPTFGPAPRPLLLCEDPTVIGAPFYVMERRVGVVVRRELPDTLAGRDRSVRLCASVVSCLADLHAIEPASVGLDDFGRPVGFVGRQVRGWTQRYHAAATDRLPDMDWVAGWLAERVPTEGGVSVIHNDFKLDNLMLSAADLTRVTAVLDWEMATLGDPLMDLGTSLAYWIEATDPEPLRRVAMGPTDAPGMWTRRQVVEAYFERRGQVAVDMGFYYVFGQFKLAVIVQQIYARYVRGATADRRFASMNQVTAVMAASAAAAARDPNALR